MKAAVILAAVAALASASTTARRSNDFEPIKIDGDCIVVADGPNDRNEYTLALGDCADAVNFYFDAETSQLQSDVDERCLSAVPVEGGKHVPGLASCKDRPAKQWACVEGDRWLNEETCDCLDVKDGDLVFGDCKKAPKCEYAQAPEPSNPECQAKPQPKPQPKPDNGCGSMPACPANCECQSDKCVAPFQCSSDKQCAYGQVCYQGWCVYPEPTCGNGGVKCPPGYVCDPKCNQCVMPPPKCPPGYVQEGYWCVPIKPECYWDKECPSGTVCQCGKCVPATCKKDTDCWFGYACVKGVCVALPPPPKPECKKDSDCKTGFSCVNGVCQKVQPQCFRDQDCKATEVCEAGACVAAPACLPGCLGNCIHGECVPVCTRDQQCADNEACEGGICVLVDCSACPDDCNHGQCTITCDVDSDCPLTDACENGVCAYQSTCDACFTTCVHGACPGPNDGRRAAGIFGWFN